MQKIKMVVLDLDDTLLTPHDTKISEENLNAIRRAQRSGILVTIATGRIYSAIKKIVEELNITCPVIASNGADVRLNHESIMTCFAKKESMYDVVLEAKRNKARVYLFSDQDIWCTHEEYSEVLFKKWRMGEKGHLPVQMKDNFDIVFDNVGSNILKALIWTENKDQHSALLKGLNNCVDDVTIAVGEALNVEVTAKGVSKAYALKTVAEKCGVSFENIMAVGDSENDIEMLVEAGLSVAVSNAMPKTKAVCDHTVASCKENGVAQAIERFCIVV